MKNDTQLSDFNKLIILFFDILSYQTIWYKNKIKNR
jgi:hypothetical protein